jgi:predicted RNase H-like nuclease (RuvC/YqgF family)
MSSTARREGVFVAASARLSNGEQKDWSQLSRKRLIKLIHKIKARYVGTDNPTEILHNGESIAAFAQLLPSSCSFVHINLTKSGSTLPLRHLLRQYNLNPNRRKLSPILTARAIVRLIQLGIGMQLEPFEKETIIEIGRPRSTGRGGWSQSRYERQGEEIVGRATKLIRTTLEKNSLSFDEVVRTTKFGAKQSRFHVFASKPRIQTTLKSLSLYPAKVKIWSPKKHVITHKPIDEGEKEHRAKFYNHIQRLIVGIDPGMTTGVAIFNLGGKAISIFSRKNLSKGKLVSEISKYGIPVLICSDVHPVPAFVNKLASTYNAEISFPTAQLSQNEKRQLANSMNILQSLDSHERDAVSAVVQAYRKLKVHFDKLENEKLTRKELDLAKGLLIRGLSIADSLTAVQMLKKKPEIERPEMIKQQVSPEEYIGRLYNVLGEMAISEETITNLRAHTGRLEATLNQYEMRNKRLMWELSQSKNELTRELLSAELLEEKELELKYLRQTIEKLEHEKTNMHEVNSALERLLWHSLEQGGVPVKVLPVFSRDAIYKLAQEKGIYKGDILLILDPSGGGPLTAQTLAETKPRIVFLNNMDLTTQAMQILVDKEIPVMRGENYDIHRIGQLAVINPHNLERALMDYDTLSKERSSRDRKNKIDLEIENYTYEREQVLEHTTPNYDDFEPDEEELSEL